MKSIFNFFFICRCFVPKNIVALMAVLSIFVVSCQKDITSQPNKVKRVEAIPTVSLNEAQDYFSLTKTNSFAGAAIDLNPLWSDAYLDTALSGKKYLMVSLGSRFRINRQVSEAKLMFYRSSDGAIKSQIFAFSPTAEYKERKNGVLEIEDFTGFIMFYELDGSLKNAPYFRDGQFIGLGSATRTPPNSRCVQRIVYVEFDCEGCAFFVTVCEGSPIGGSGGTWGNTSGATGTGGNGSNTGVSTGTGTNGGGTAGTGGSGTGTGSGSNGPGGNCLVCSNDDLPNPPIPPVVSIINQLSECRAEVFSTLQNKLTGDFAQFLSNFQTNTNGLNLKIKESYLQGTDINNDAETIRNGDTWEITLNRNVLDFSSKEYIAITIYHEVIHAYLDAYFPSIVTTDLNTQHHQYMANQCVDYMATTLQELFPNLSINDATALSWQGLNGNFKFKNGVVEPNSYWNMLPEATRINYINRNNQFKTGKLNGTGTQCN